MQQHTLKIVDSRTGNILSTIPLTGRPNQCGATPDGRYVAVPIRDGNSVDIVDPQAKKVVKTLPVKLPHNSYNSGSNDTLWVSSMGDHEIDRIDLRKMEYTAHVRTEGIPRPYTVTKDGDTIYSALTDLHGFVVASVSEGKVIAKVELPAGRTSSQLRARTQYAGSRAGTLARRPPSVGNHPGRRLGVCL